MTSSKYKGSENMRLSKDKIVKIANKRNLPVKIDEIVKIEDLFEERTFIIDYKTEICYCGAYMIITRDGENYAGSTENFFERMYEHIYNTIKGKIPMFACLFETKDMCDAMILERWLIQKFNPPLNVNLRSEYRYKGLNDDEILSLRKKVKSGFVRRNGLFDMIKNVQIKESLKDI